MVERMRIVVSIYNVLASYNFQINTFKICFDFFLKYCIRWNNVKDCVPWILSIILQFVLEVGKNRKVIKHSRLDEILWARFPMVEMNIDLHNALITVALAYYHIQIMIFKICFDNILKSFTGWDVDEETLPWILGIFLQLILEVGRDRKILKYSRLDESLMEMFQRNELKIGYIEHLLYDILKSCGIYTGVYAEWSQKKQQLRNNTCSYLMFCGFYEFQFLSDKYIIQLAKILQGNKSVHTVHINNMWNNLTIKGYTAFADCLNINTTIRSIKIDCSTRISDECMHILATAIKNSKVLKEFHVISRGPGTKLLNFTALEAIVGATQYSTSLATLYLQNTLQHLSDKDVVNNRTRIFLLVHQLSSLLQHSTTLQGINMDSSMMLFAHSSIEIIFMKGLRTNNCLKNLSVRNCNIGNDGIIELAKSIDNNTSTSLQTLNLEKNGVDDTGASVLFHVLRTNKTIERLVMKDNSIGNTSTIVLADSLYWNTSLKSIDLSCNNISEKGAVALAKSLRYNPTVTELDLTDNPINENSVTCFITSVAFNDTIEKLYLGWFCLTICPALEQRLRNLNDPHYFLRYNTKLIDYCFQFKNISINPTDRNCPIRRSRDSNHGVPRRSDTFTTLLAKAGCFSVKRPTCNKQTKLSFKIST